MIRGTLISYAQNREDVVLWRALGHISGGRYIDVGAWDAEVHSVTKALYDRGWKGVNVEPVPHQAEALRESRPRDEVVQAAVSSVSGSLPFFEIHYSDGSQAITGLSTLDLSIAEAHAADGWDVREITVPSRTLDQVWADSTLTSGEVHLLKIDVEGAEADVLSSLALAERRPWVVVVEATLPLSTEASHGTWEPALLEAGYAFCLFDGLSRFYVAKEHAELVPALSYPACVFDDYTTAPEADLRAQVDTLTARVTEAAEREDAFAAQAADREVAFAAEAAERERINSDVRNELWADLLRWRSAALDGWASAVADQVPAPAAGDPAETAALREEVNALRSSLSWRLTAPLRRASEQGRLQAAATKLRRR